MALSRALKNDMRSSKKPGSGSSKQGSSETPSQKQYGQSGPKSTGPNYPQYKSKANKDGNIN